MSTFSIFKILTIVRNFSRHSNKRLINYRTLWTTGLDPEFQQLPRRTTIGSTSNLHKPITFNQIIRHNHGNKVENNYINVAPSELDGVTFDETCSETLEALCEYFDELLDRTPSEKNADVTYSDGVLTIKLSIGTYVINRQTPNRQIWLSSPFSGPKRYDFYVLKGDVTGETKPNGCWIYRHEGNTLHELLQKEISKILPQHDINFCRLPFGSK